MYQEFVWQSTEAANGKSGEKLADALVARVKKIDGVESICDLGCGNGYIAGCLAKLGFKVTGVDASRSGIELAKENYPQAEFICAMIDGGISQFVSGEKFDLVISSDVIEHLYKPSDLLDAASALLKPRGHLIVGTPYHGYLKNLALSLSGRMDAHFTALWDGGHVKFFSVKTLSELIAGRGFSDLRFSYYGRAPYLWKNMICHARAA